MLISSSQVLRVYAYTLQHQSARDALVQVRPILSPRGSVEEQPGSNTVVVRDVRVVITRVAAALVAFDRPLENLRLDIRVVRAGPHQEPSRAGLQADAEMPPEMLGRLKGFLRYEDYQVMAQAAVTSREGEQVTYSLGEHYDVSFRLGSVMAEQRLKLSDFRIVKKPQRGTNKGRRLEPRELIRATLNLWIDKPFALVLARDDERQEALMVAISCRRETEPSP